MCVCVCGGGYIENSFIEINLYSFHYGSLNLVKAGTYMSSSKVHSYHTTLVVFLIALKILVTVLRTLVTWSVPAWSLCLSCPAASSSRTTFCPGNSKITGRVLNIRSASSLGTILSASKISGRILNISVET